MNGRFIKWLKSQDAAFRDAYLEEVGEAIGSNVREDDTETYYLVSSFRITSINESNLSEDYTIECTNTLDEDGEPIRRPDGWTDLVV